MPELPEVKTVVKYIAKDIVGQKMVDSDFLIPKMVNGLNVKQTIDKLIGKTVLSVENFGKFIIFNFDKNTSLLSHLRMEGKYRFAVNLELTKHDHAWFKFQKGYLIYNDVRKFGTFEIKKTNEIFSTNPLMKLGKLPSNIDIDWFYKKLKKKNIAIKSALLDQNLILGLGNIYVDEVLFAAKINPSRSSSSLTMADVVLVVKKAISIIKKATEKGGSSIRTYKAYGNIEGTYQNYLKVHMRENKNCINCKSKIKKIKINGRGTYFCPHCQG